ncbi:hypothetical protein [Pseudoalteromonas sp. KAN5]|uniref:hypothetical protein n=1 Tax=Pseudoalteromonas sp. KAN5 TaxID=2916633 RepID=UPI001FCAAFFA|nr:hypothetical protein [Pseudoalteromonas sp. KAN5]BDF94301.1 hypothetical protein KAN5_11390 [Pseudoalteromonas sp. KAN5]
MKKLLLTLAAVAVLGGCKSTEDAYKASALLTYPEKPSDQDVGLSLGVSPSSDFKCYPSNFTVGDNITPQSSQGYYCYRTNKGNFVFDGSNFIGLGNFNETMRKHDDVYTYLNHYYADNKDVYPLKKAAPALVKAESPSAHTLGLNSKNKILKACKSMTRLQIDNLLKELQSTSIKWSGKISDISEKDYNYDSVIAFIETEYLDRELKRFDETITVKERLYVAAHIPSKYQSGLVDFNINDTVIFEGKITRIEQRDIIYDYQCQVSFTDVKLTKAPN